MLDKYSFTSFECMFGYQGVLRDIKDILSFQKVVVGDTRAAIMGLKDDRHVHILEKVHAGRVHFHVLKKYIAHAKLYLLSSTNGHTRVIVGSANLSERAFSGNQPETLVKFDDDEDAWHHYSRMFDLIRDASTDEIPLPDDRISEAETEISETPVMANLLATLVIESPSSEENELAAPIQISRVEKIAASFQERRAAVVP
jgi:phosphatidylserine/phosphatidylglycerophosphate/cardiolipin synthase-like enzyme